MEDPWLDPFERRVALLGTNLATLTDLLLRTTTRMVALAELLTRHGLLTAAELAAQSATIHAAATFAVEFSPEYKEFRRLGRQILGGDASEPDEES